MGSPVTSRAVSTEEWPMCTHPVRTAVPKPSEMQYIVCVGGEWMVGGEISAAGWRLAGERLASSNSGKRDALLY